MAQFRSEFFTSFRIYVFVTLGLSIGIAASGCRTASAPTTADTMQSFWSRSAILDHLRVLNSSEVAGRATGTKAFALAADYLASRMGQYELQPVLQSDYRVMYPMPVHYVLFASLTMADRDTVTFRAGSDFLPDARSDSGSVEISRVQRLQEIGAREIPSGTAVLVPMEHGTDSVLIGLRSRGARTVFLTGDLRPAQATHPLSRLLIFQVSPQTIPFITSALSAKQEERPTLLVRAETYDQPLAGGVVVMGYIAGKHPVLAHELVIVCADLDAIGPVGGVPTIDLEHMGAAVSALLEVARVQAASAEAFSTPERTVLIAAWPGGLLDHSGFRAYLNRPVWPLDATRAIIYLGLRQNDADRLRELLSPHGIDLYAVSSPDSLPPRNLTMAPLANSGASSPIKAQQSDGDDLSRALDQASVTTERMATSANDLLVSLAIAPVSMPSAPQDQPASGAQKGGR